LDYFHSMNDKKLFFKADKVAFMLGAVLLIMLTECVGYDEEPRAGSVDGTPPAVETTAVMQDDYVYYPGYDVYYNSNRRQYAYLEGGAWVSRPAPCGVPVDVLLASPSVRMDFHDSPAQHHAVMVQKYPRKWAPPGSNQGQKENRKDHNYITDVSSLTNLPRLAYLDLSCNALTNISPLLALSNLVELDVQNNYLDLSSTSAATSTILALTQRGVVVNYKPQRARPTISNLPDQTIGMGGGSPVLLFQYSPDSAMLSVHSSNPGLIPETNICLTPSPHVANIILTPVYGATGTAVITLTATVDKGMSASTSLNVNVVPSSPAPIRTASSKR
jgi:hypothetical protein